MKIVHITHHYIDGWGYQDNLLPKYQLKFGHVVSVITDKSHLDIAGEDSKKSIKDKGNEYYVEGVKIIRLNNYINTSNTSFISTGLYRRLIKEKPDMIFHHGVDSSTLIVATLYKFFHKKVILQVDNHVDYINQSKNKIWSFFYNKILLRTVSSLIIPYVNKYWGLSPLRCDYLHEVYHIPKHKIFFLPFGGDTDLVDSIDDSKQKLRIEYGIPKDAFVISSGGKMDKTKGTNYLIDAYHEIKKENKNVCLVLFGKCDDEIKKYIEQFDDIILFGWCNREKTLSLLKLSDIAVWPLLHTTLIEDAISCATPIIVKSSGNTRHLISESNGIYLKEGDEKELLLSIKKTLNSAEMDKFKKNALRLKAKYSYNNVSLMTTDLNYTD